MQKGVKGKLYRWFSKEGIRLFSFNINQGLIDADELPRSYRMDPESMQTAAFKSMRNYGYREENCDVIFDGFKKAMEGSHKSYDLRRYSAGVICFERESFLENGLVNLVNWCVRDTSAPRPKVPQISS